MSKEFIAQRPEAQLIYPGAVVKSTTVDGESAGIDSTSEAKVEHVIQSDAPLDAVARWYQAELLKLGWTAVTAGVFTRGREDFDVGLDPNAPYLDATGRATLIDVQYFIRPAR